MTNATAADSQLQKPRQIKQVGEPGSQAACSSKSSAAALYQTLYRVLYTKQFSVLNYILVNYIPACSQPARLKVAPPPHIKHTWQDYTIYSIHNSLASGDTLYFALHH